MTSRVGLSNLWSPQIDTWRDRAACKGQHELFEQPDRDTHPDLTIADRKTLGEARIGLARALCAGCTVRQQCEDDASIVDRLVTIRNGIIPWDRTEEAKALGDDVKVQTWRRQGRPRKNAAVLPDGRVVGLEEAYTEYVALVKAGYDSADCAKMLSLPVERILVFRRKFLDSVTKRNASAIIRKNYLSRSGKPMVAGNAGLAWLVSRSECGRVLLVATRKGGRAAIAFFPSNRVDVLRTDVAVLSVFPPDLAVGQQRQDVGP